MAKKRRSRSSPELPRDIIFCNILPRLPAKSLLRFKCVSKQWHSSLTTRLFAQMHLHHATKDNHQNHHKLVALSTKTPYVFHTIDCEAPEDGLTASHPFPFKASYKGVKILTSCDGLVCVGLTMDWHEYSELILWNPLIGDYKTMSRINTHKECYNMESGIFGLYYSSCDDNYRLLRLTYRYRYAYIYSLKSNSWRKIDKTRDLYTRCSRTSTHVMNEKMYFLNNGDGSSVEGLHDSIIMFDTKTEKFKKISTPSIKSRNAFRLRGLLTVLKGCIHLFVMHRDYESRHVIELWRMGGDGDGDVDGDWKKVRIPNRYYDIDDRDQPLHFMRNGELLTYSTRTHYLRKLPLTSPNYTKIKISCDYSTYIPKRGKYTETLVSPNRSIIIDEVEKLREQVETMQEALRQSEKQMETMRETMQNEVARQVEEREMQMREREVQALAQMQAQNQKLIQQQLAELMKNYKPDGNP